MVALVDLREPIDLRQLWDAEPDEAEFVARGLLQIASALKRHDSRINAEPFFGLAGLILERSRPS